MPFTTVIDLSRVDLAQMETIRMVACPQCTAKFASTAEIEAQWLETHLARFHGRTRATKMSFAVSLTEKHAA